MFGLSTRALRYYEQLGLLSPAGRTESNQRYYTQGQLRQFRQVLRLKELGFRVKDLAQAFRVCQEEGLSLEERYAAKIELLLERREWLTERMGELEGALSRLQEGLETLERRREAAASELDRDSHKG